MMNTALVIIDRSAPRLANDHLLLHALSVAIPAVTCCQTQRLAPCPPSGHTVRLRTSVNTHKRVVLTLLITATTDDASAPARAARPAQHLRGMSASPATDTRRECGNVGCASRALTARLVEMSARSRSSQRTRRVIERGDVLLGELVDNIHQEPVPRLTLETEAIQKQRPDVKRSPAASAPLEAWISVGSAHTCRRTVPTDAHTTLTDHGFQTRGLRG